MLCAQMIEVCDQSELLRHARALEHWADCRERAVARLERRVKHLVEQKREVQDARLQSAAHFLREAAIRDRLHAVALRRAAQP